MRSGRIRGPDGLRFPVHRPKLGGVNEDQQARYSRHILLPGIGESGQKRLLGSRALIIGLGGLGSPAAMYLAASGVGELVLSDYDYVELSNLQRQIIHTSADLGRDKVDSARDAIARLNPEISVEALAHALDDEDLEGRSAARRRGGGRLRQFRDPIRAQRGLLAHRHPAGERCRGTPGRTGQRVRSAGLREPLLSLPLRRCGRGGRRTLLPDWRARAASRHHRQHSGDRGPERYSPTSARG